MHLAIFSDYVGIEGHPSFEYVMRVMDSESWEHTPHVVYLHASPQLSEHVKEWASRMLFCTVKTPRSMEGDKEASPRTMLPVRRKSVGSPRLSAWPLYMIEHCTHAFVFIHPQSDTNQTTQHVVSELLKRTTKISFQIHTVNKKDWIGVCVCVCVSALRAERLMRGAPTKMCVCVSALRAERLMRGAPTKMCVCVCV